MQLIQWHQEQDNRPPLSVVDDKLVPSADTTVIAENTACDKIVVYCAFPSSYTQVTQV